MQKDFIEQFTKFQKTFDKEFEARFKKSIIGDCGKTVFTKKIIEALEAFVLRESKRIRPFLFFVSSQIDYSSKKAENLWDFAIGIELVHSAMLIHDDIMDNSPIRRGGESIHEIFDIDQAITIGDMSLLLAYDFMLIGEENINNKQKAARLFIKNALDTAEGQSIDLHYLDKKKLSKEELFTLYELKTAAYSFIGPLVAGAMLGDNTGYINTLENIGKKIGVLFQLQDDLIDISEENSLIRKVDEDLSAEKTRLYNELSNEIDKSDLPKDIQNTLKELSDFIYAKNT